MVRYPPPLGLIHCSLTQLWSISRILCWGHRYALREQPRAERRRLLDGWKRRKEHPLPEQLLRRRPWCIYRLSWTGRRCCRRSECFVCRCAVVLGTSLLTGTGSGWDQNRECRDGTLASAAAVGIVSGIDVSRCRKTACMARGSRAGLAVTVSHGSRWRDAKLPDLSYHVHCVALPGRTSRSTTSCSRCVCILLQSDVQELMNAQLRRFTLHKSE